MEAQRGGLMEAQSKKLRTLLSQYNLNLHKQEVLWKQKARANRLRDGNVYTKYFHRSTIIRRNRILMIKDDYDALREHPDDIKHILLHHFHKRWTYQQGVSDVDNPII